MLKIYYENREVENTNYSMQYEVAHKELIFISYLCESGKVKYHVDDNNDKFVYLKDLIPFKGAKYVCYPKEYIPDLAYIPESVYIHQFTLYDIYCIMMNNCIKDDENNVSELYTTVANKMIMEYVDNNGVSLRNINFNILAFIEQELMKDSRCSKDLSEFIKAENNSDKFYASIGSAFYHYFSVYIEQRSVKICGYINNYDFNISDTRYNKNGENGEFDDFWEEMNCLLKELRIKRLFFKPSSPYGILRNKAFDDFKIVQYLYQPNGCNDLPFSIDKIFVFFNKDGEIFADNFVRKCKKCGRYFRIGEQDIYRAKHNMINGKKYILPSTCKHCVQKLDLFPNANKKKKGDASEIKQQD